MKSAVSFFLSNGDIVVVNKMSMDFENEMRTMDQKMKVLKEAIQIAKDNLVRECIFTEWQVEKMFKKPKMGISPFWAKLPEFVWIPREGFEEYFKDPQNAKDEAWYKTVMNPANWKAKK